MGTTRLRIFAAATESIVAQADYYQQNENEALAQRWIESVQATFRQLLQFPQSRPRVTLSPHHGDALPNDLRRAIVMGFPEHLIFYRYISTEDVVKVVVVMDGCRELERALEAVPMAE